MTNVETAKILATIAAVYQNFGVNDFKQSIWGELLKDTDYRHAVRALTGLLKSLKFAPTPADIIELSKVEKLLEFERMEEQRIEHGRNPEIPDGNARRLSQGKC